MASIKIAGLGPFKCTEAESIVTDLPIKSTASATEPNHLVKVSDLDDTGDLQSDGSVPLTADWDVGDYEIILRSLELDGSIQFNSSLVDNFYIDNQVTDGIIYFRTKHSGSVDIKFEIDYNLIKAHTDMEIVHNNNHAKLTVYAEGTGNKGFITVESDEEDARIDIISDTDSGDDPVLSFYRKSSRIGMLAGDPGHDRIQLYSIGELVLRPSDTNKTVIIGYGESGSNPRLLFDGNTNDGIIKWDNTNDRFIFEDDVTLGAGTQLDLHTYNVELLLHRASTSGAPTPAEGELMIYRDYATHKVYLIYKDSNEGVVKVELT